VKRLSSAATPFLKFGVPVLGIGFLAVWTGIAVRSGPFEEVWMFPLFALLMLLIWAFVYYRFIWDVADEVMDGGDHLLVRRRGQQERIRLQDIINIAFERRQNGRRTVLRLARAGVFGDRIVFIPAMRLRFSFSVTDPEEEELIRRVDAARRAQA
jgi:hypothetical protein